MIQGDGGPWVEIAVSQPHSQNISHIVHFSHVSLPVVVAIVGTLPMYVHTNTTTPERKCNLKIRCVTFP